MLVEVIFNKAGTTNLNLQAKSTIISRPETLTEEVFDSPRSRLPIPNNVPVFSARPLLLLGTKLVFFEGGPTSLVRKKYIE